MSTPSTLSATLWLGALLALGATPVGAQFVSLEAVSGEPAARFALPPRLHEISGLAWHPDGYLVAHDDEVGVLHLIDPHTGRTVERIGLGRRHARGDFEGVALLEDGSVLVTTSFAELVRRDPDGTARSWGTDVEQVCEVEGLDALPGDSVGSGEAELVMACKEIYRRADRDALLLVGVSATEPGRAHGRGGGAARSRADVLIRIEADSLEAAGVPSPFLASGVAVVDNGILVLSARNRVVVHLSRDGRIWGVARLDRRLHEQPEGIAVDPQGRIWIADEGGRREAAHLTRYDRRTAGGPDGMRVGGRIHVPR